MNTEVRFSHISHEIPLESQRELIARIDRRFRTGYR
jgi:hypothetical protein